MRGYWVLILLLLPSVHAATMSAEYDIGLTETRVTHTFTDVQENLSVALPYDVSRAEINGQQVRTAGHARINTTNATLRYASSAHTERASYFVADLAGIDAELDIVTVQLPSGSSLQRGLNQQDASIHPRPRDAFTDGKRLIFTWQGSDLEPARAVLVDYDTGMPGPHLLFVVAGALILAGLLIFVTGRPEKNTTDLTRNLYEEEKQLVEILLAQEDQEMWQKQLVHASGLSKVKVSRKLRNLEKKGVIEKIPHGNTNKIRIKHET